MAAFEVLSLDPATPQIRAPGAGDTYTFPRQALFLAGTVGAPGIAQTSDDNTGMWWPAADTLAWSTNGSERMRLDAAGNLGLGVTPSAWATIGPVLQVKQASLVSDSFDQLYLSANAFFDGAWKFMQSDIATQYYQASGQHVWRTAASGTAGNAISFTQAMTLDANGRLLLGTTSATGASMDIQATSTGTAQLLNIQNLSSGASAVSRFSIGSQGGNWHIDNERTGAPLKFIFNTSLYLTLDSSGNVVTGSAAIATNATNGFLYVPTCAGTPTGTPTTYTGRSPIVVDTTNNKLYFYSGGQWRDAGP